MIRSLFRLIGLLALAAGFVFLIYDGARSIADQTVQFLPFGEFWNDIHQSSQSAFQAQIEAFSPWLWNHAGVFVLAQPTWAILGALGLFLLLAFRPRKALIGYARD